MVGTAVATTLESIAATKMATIRPNVTRTVWAVQVTLPAVRTFVVTGVDYGTGQRGRGRVGSETICRLTREVGHVPADGRAGRADLRIHLAGAGQWRILVGFPVAREIAVLMVGQHHERSALNVYRRWYGSPGWWRRGLQRVTGQGPAGQAVMSRRRKMTSPTRPASTPTASGTRNCQVPAHRCSTITCPAGA